MKRAATFIFVLVLTACSMPGLSFIPEPLAALPASLQTQPAGLVVAPPDATPTATPFQPLPPTPVFTPTEILTPTPLPTATPEPIALPTDLPPEVLEQAPDRMNILLLGSDKRPWDSGFRTDTIILLSLNPADGTASTVSFPRDLWVTIPGWTQERINTAFYHGGFKTLAATLEHNFGVRPTHYVLINFRSFKQIIDGLGGLDVKVGTTLRDKYTGKGWITIKKGTVHMNADIILWYVRSRKTTNDFARNRRQQEVLIALFEKLVSMEAIKRAPDIYNSYKKSVVTDLKLTDMLPLLPLAIQLADTSNIKRYYISPEMVWDWITPGGAMVLLPREDAIRKVVQKAVKGK